MKKKQQNKIKNKSYCKAFCVTRKHNKQETSQRQKLTSPKIYSSKKKLIKFQF